MAATLTITVLFCLSANIFFYNTQYLTFMLQKALSQRYQLTCICILQHKSIIYEGHHIVARVAGTGVYSSTQRNFEDARMRGE